MFFNRQPIREKTLQTMLINGQQVPFMLVRSRLARRVSLKASALRGLQIIVPFGLRPGKLRDIVMGHQDWIIRALQKIEAHKQNQNHETFKDGVTISILGQPKTIRVLPSRKKPHVKEARKLKLTNDTAYYDGQELVIFCDGSIHMAKQTLEKYLRGIAEKYFEKRAAEWSKAIGTTHSSITIRGQKTRWGSCSREKSLNFNWRLIMAPLEVIDAIIVHEMAHTIHLNHSKSFYALVEKFIPEYRRIVKQLNKIHFLL